jgi:hypothetical protein
VHSFGVGDDWEVGVSEALIHPSLWVNPINADMPKTDNGYSSYSVDFSIKLFDLVNKDESNENEVLSDIFEILKDIVNEFNTHPFYNDSDFEIEGDISFDPFTERYDEEVSGWEATFTITSPNRRSFCSSPIDDIDPYNFEPSSVTVTDAENPNSPITLHLGDEYTCIAAVPKSGIKYQRPMSSGQEISYRIGDAVWREINMPYPADPVNPLYVQELGANWFTLKHPNAFGNYFRFTDISGNFTITDDYTVAPDYSYRYIIDHLTGLGIDSYVSYRDNNKSWDTAIDDCLNHTAHGFSDYYLASLNEFNSFLNSEVSFYSLNMWWVGGNRTQWTSNTKSRAIPTQALVQGTVYANISSTKSSANRNYMPIRVHY